MPIRNVLTLQYAAAAVALGVTAIACSNGTKEPAIVKFAPVSATSPATVPTLVLIPVATTSPATQPFVSPFAAIDDHHLYNAYRLTPKLISGAQPDDEEAFKALSKLGVTTIISVDGAKPDVALAKKYGMKYVHIPINYNGVTPEQGRQIAKAMQIEPGPIYLHCHHGKHRSAAAVAVACVYNGMLQPEQAEAVLKTFGTGANYIGLWRDARAARPLAAGELEALQVDFVDTARIADMADRMVALDHSWDNVKVIQKAGWKQPADHPDLDPAHEVLQVQEHLTESARLESTANRPEKFRVMLNESTKETAALIELLGKAPVDAALADAAFKKIAASCTSCHAAYRD